MRYFFITIFCLLSIQSSIQASDPSIFKKVKYEGSLAYTQMSKGSWWTKIEPFPIYLGALPLKNKGHLQEIVDLGVTRILAVVEDFELEEGYLHTPVKAEDWEPQGIQVTQIPAVDYEALTQSELENGMQWLAHMVDGGIQCMFTVKQGAAEVYLSSLPI